MRRRMWERSKKMERNWTEAGKGKINENRRRCAKEKRGEKGGGRLMETESVYLPFQFSRAVILTSD